MPGAFSADFSLRMLRVHDELQSPLAGLPQRLIVRQAVRLAQCDGRHPVAVEQNVLRVAHVQPPVVGLLVDQPLQAAGHFRTVVAFAVRVPCAEEREQRQSGRRRIGLERARSATAMPPAVCI